MISNRELKGQIEELTEQNQLLTQELQNIKEFIQKQKDHRNQRNNQDQDQQQQRDENSDSQDRNQDGQNQMFDLANDFMKLKDLTNSLEAKMQQFVSQSPNKNNLSEEDVINLILNMMNGMIDWTVDFVSKQKNQNAPYQ